jgi:pterin-4a-carbinolamine dehydratase
MDITTDAMTTGSRAPSYDGGDSGGISEKLKAERIQGPERIHAQLKAERIQELLQELPDWSLVRRGTAITRTYPVNASGPRPVVAFAGYVSELAEEHGVMADLDLRLGRVVVTLSGLPTRGLTEDDFELARALEMQW